MKKLILFLLFATTVQHCLAQAQNYGNVAIFLDDVEEVRSFPDIGQFPSVAGYVACNIARDPEHYVFILTALIFKNVIELAKIEHEKTGKMFLLDSLNRYKIFGSKDKRFFILTASIYEETMLRFIDKRKIEAIDLSLLIQSFDTTDTKLYSSQNLISLWSRNPIPLNIFLYGHGDYVDLPGTFTQKKRFSHRDLTSGYVGGLSMVEYVKLIDHFKTININFLYVKSCYVGGGLNMTIPYFTQFLDKKGHIVTDDKKPNFTIVLGSLTDINVHRNVMLTALTYSFKPRFDDASNLNAFFKHLANKKVYSNDELKDILRPITPRITRILQKKILRCMPNITALPNIYSPGAKSFILLELDEKVGILTKAKAKKHEKEHKEIVFKKKDVVAIYPSNIRAPIKIEQGSLYCFGITFMRPGSVLTRINRLSFDRTFNELLFALAFGQGAHEYPSNSVKCVYIKSLMTKDVEFYHVMLCIEKDSLNLLYIDKNKEIKFDMFKVDKYELERIGREPTVLEKLAGMPPKNLREALSKYQEVLRRQNRAISSLLNEDILCPIIELYQEK